MSPHPPPGREHVPNDRCPVVAAVDVRVRGPGRRPRGSLRSGDAPRIMDCLRIHGYCGGA
eukprot:4264945-Alexandrium_andersonii.AAC.1